MASPIFILFAFALVVAQFAIRRQLAFLPLIIAACHFQYLPVIEAGAAFTTTKLVILAGLIRAVSERRFVWTSRQKLDVLIALWAAWAVASTVGHSPDDHNPLTIRLSLVYDLAGTYLYARAFLKTQEDFLRLCKCLAFSIIPLAAIVLIEKTTLQNVYGMISGLAQEAAIRGGKVRATGPFSHPILLGTFGATSLVVLFPLIREHRKLFTVAVVACLVIVFSSASSGPIMTLMSGLMAMALWRFRKSVGWIRRIVLFSIVVLHLVMQAPVWYLMARIDLAGGSTGWHRAELITAAINHLGEWWLIGTDYTRHWMPYGIEWSGNQTDITNYYIQMGVVGGVPLMLLFIAILIKSFQMLGRNMRRLRASGDSKEFVLWCIGAALFAHSFTFISVSYFDQSFVQLFILIGAVPGLCAATFKRKMTTAAPNFSASQPSGREPFTGLSH